MFGKTKTYSHLFQILIVTNHIDKWIDWIN